MMAAPPPARGPAPEAPAQRNWMLIALLGGGGVVAAAIALWLLTGGMATLAHIFAMRQILRPDQTAQFDRAVVKALTDDAR